MYNARWVQRNVGCFGLGACVRPGNNALCLVRNRACRSPSHRCTSCIRQRLVRVRNIPRKVCYTLTPCQGAVGELGTRAALEATAPSTCPRVGTCYCLANYFYS